VTGSAIAIPLLGVSAASAADVTTWDKVAECESGGVWSSDTDNGFYGGLQLAQETWEQYGGLEYAPRADLASRSQQIAVGEKVLATEGPKKVWPSCATVAGLTQGGAEADVDPGLPVVGETLEPQPPAMGPTGSMDCAESTGASGSSDPADSEATTDDSASADAETGAGRHRGGRAPEDESTANADKIRESTGRHASRGGADAGRAEVSGGGDGDTYTVRPGDTLWGIADAHSVEGGWTALYEANKQAVGVDPDAILPGQLLEFGIER
jgi:hypothetical protein